MNHVYFNGKVVPEAEARLPATSDAVRIGAGTFETIRWCDGELKFLDDHWQRLTTSCLALGLVPPPPARLITQGAATLAAVTGIANGVARFSLHSNGRNADHLLQLTPLRSLFHRETLRLATSPIPHPGASPLSSAKTNNYWRNRLALEEAHNAGADDAVLLGPAGPVETAVANLYFFHEGAWWLPPVSSGALPGVIRSKVLVALSELGLPFQETPIDCETARNAEAILVSNSLIGLRAVVQWDDRSYPVPGGILATIRHAAGLGESYDPKNLR